MKYEIEHVAYLNHYIESEIARLTGLELEEILVVSGKVTRWNGSAYVRTIQSLGYSCNPRFKKFNKETEYPSLMRCHRIRKKEKYWYGFVYYDGFVYDVYNGRMTWAEWNHIYTDMRVTSMLQVWI